VKYVRAVVLWDVVMHTKEEAGTELDKGKQIVEDVSNIEEILITKVDMVEEDMVLMVMAMLEGKMLNKTIMVPLIRTSHLQNRMQ
jgi:hypothetical protein